MLSEFDLVYKPLNVIKGRAVSDFLAENAIPENQPIDTEDLPDENIFHTIDEPWSLYFYGASNYRGCGIGILLISPTGDHNPISIKLNFGVTNNAAEYEACLYGLRAAIELDIKTLKVYGDSSLIINQASGNWEMKSDNLRPYLQKIEELILKFKDIEFIHLPREDNQFADALAKVSSLINLPDHMANYPITIESQDEPAYVNEINTVEPWYQPIINFKKTGEYPPGLDKRAKRGLRMQAAQYALNQNELFKKTPQGVLIIGIDEDKNQIRVKQSKINKHTKLKSTAKIQRRDQNYKNQKSTETRSTYPN